MTTQISDSGGFEGSNLNLQLETSDGSTLTYRYEHFTIPDNFQIRYEGSVLFATGFVGGSATGTIDVPAGTADTVQIIVGTDDAGTAWNYNVTAEPNDCPIKTGVLRVTSTEEFVHDAQAKTCTTTGTVTIARKDGIGSIRVVGGTTVIDDNSKSVKVTGGTVFSDVGGVAEPLFAGNFELAFASGAGSALTESGTPANDFDLAGIEVDFNSLSVFSGNVRGGVSFQLPVDIGSIQIGPATVNDPTVILNGGVNLGLGASIDIPNANFRFFNLFDVTATNQKLSYQSSADLLKLQGKYEVGSFAKGFPVSKVTLDLSGDNRVQIQDGTPDVVGVMTVESDLEVRGFGLKEIQISVNTIADTVGGSVKVGFPFKGKPLEVTGSLEFTTNPDLALNRVGITVDKLNAPIPQFPVVFLQSLGGGVNNISPADPDPVAFEGSIGLTAGPQIPDGSGGEVALARLNLNGSLDLTKIVGTGTLTMVNDNVLAATGTGTVNWDQGIFTYAGNFNLFNGFFTTSNTINANTNFDFSFGGMAAAQVPNLSQVPAVIRGKALGNANYLVNFTNDGNTGNDFAAAWATVNFAGSDHFLGAKFTFDGDASLFGANNIPAAGSSVPLAAPPGDGGLGPLEAAVSEGFTIGAGQPWLLLTATWENASAGVQVKVMRPNGTSVDQADFGGTEIAIVGALTDNNTTTVAVTAPAAGTWTIEVVDDTGLGAVTFSAAHENAAPSLDITAPATDVAGGNVNINFNAADSDSNAELSLFYDTDNSGFDGVLIEAGIAENDGAGNFVWNTEGIAPGNYFVYGSLSDGVNPAATDYSTGRVLVTANADLEVTMTGPADGVGFGSTNDFTVTVENLGPSTANNVVLTDIIPTNATLISSSIAPTTNVGGTLTFDLGSLGSGATQDVVLSLQLNAPPDADIEVTKPAGLGNNDVATALNIDGDFVLEEDANVTDSATIPHVSIAGTGDNTRDFYEFTVSQAGSVGTFDIDFGSGGVGSFDSFIRLYDSTGAQVPNAFDDDGGGDPGSTSGLDSFLAFTFTDPGTYYVEVADFPGTDPIPNGGTYVLQVSLENATAGPPPTNGTVNSAFVDSSTFDPVGENNNDFIDVILSIPSVDLVASYTTTPGNLQVGDATNYQITITNNGPVPASNVTVVETLNGFTGLSGTPSQGTSSVSGNNITTQLGSLGVGGSATIDIEGTATTVGPASVSTNVTSTENDIDFANNTLEELFDITSGPPQPVDLSVAVSATDPNAQGQTTVTVDLNNAGPGVASDIEVHIPLPAGTAFVSSNPEQGSYDSNSGIWKVGNMRDNLTRELSLVLQAAVPVLATIVAEVINANEVDTDSTPDNQVASEDDYATTTAPVGDVNVQRGGAGDETLNGTPASDLLDGQGGDDTLNGLGSGDFLYGGPGTDALNGGDGDDTLIGGPDNDAIDGGANNDTVSNWNATGPVTVNLADGTSSGNQGNDTIVNVENADGGPGNDTLIGDDGVNQLQGFEGDDILDGGGNDDTLNGGLGVDSLYGGDGNDTLDGGPGADFMLGGVGNDTYFADNTFDLIDEGGAFPAFIGSGLDQDVIHSTADWFWDVYSVGERMIIDPDAEGSGPGGAGTTIVGSVFPNEMIGNAGTNIMFGRGGADTYQGGDGVDWYSLSLLGTDGAYPEVDGPNTIIVEPRTSGANSYDIVFEYEPGKDMFDVSAYGVASGAAVLALGVNDGFGNSYFPLGDGFDYVFVVGQETTALSPNDFIV